VTDNLLDLAVCLEISESLAGERTVDLQAIDEGRNGDEAVGLDILLELVVGLLVEDNGVVGLVLDYAAVSGESCEIVRCECEACSGGPTVVSDTAGGCLELGRCWMCAVCAVRYHVPLPFDHFFFCFLPPVAAGAFMIVSIYCSSHGAPFYSARRTILLDVWES
jgi:hypothetical protein